MYRTQPPSRMPEAQVKKASTERTVGMQTRGRLRWTARNLAASAASPPPTA
jgi:hypothetical protein